MENTFYPSPTSFPPPPHSFPGQPPRAGDKSIDLMKNSQVR